MTNWEHIGFDDKLRAKTSLSNRHKRVSSIDMDAYYDVQTNFVHASKMDLGELVKRAFGGTSLGTFATSQAIQATSNLTYKSPQSARPTFGRPIVGIYQGAGTAAADMIYPFRGVNVTLGRYDVQGGVNDYSQYNGTSDLATWMIVDTNGTSTQEITFAIDWIYVDYVSGVGE